MPNENVQHPGRVVKIEEKSVTVEIIAVSACATCHAKGMCTMSEMKEKLIQVKTPENRIIAVGDQVILEMSHANAFKALWWAYLLPFVILMTSLVIFTNILSSQGIAGLLSLAMLVPYYLILKFMQPYLKKSITFKIK